MTQTLGILGGGQLARMMVYPAKALGFRVVVLDRTPNSPAGELADEQIVGEFLDPDAVARLGAESDVLTYDLEDVNVEAVAELERAGGTEVHPSSRTLGIIRDKFAQREFLRDRGIPQPAYGEGPPTELPAVVKTRRGGYDGYGVQICKTADELARFMEGRDPADVYHEELVEIDRELAINAVRSRHGQIVFYPVCDMAMTGDNKLDMLTVPARLDPHAAEQARHIARTIVIAFGDAGNFGVELFLTKDGRILFNEVAPRPHNSGHYTIEACRTSQFENHVRAVLGLPLGEATLFQPAVTVNLIGESAGEPVLEGLAEALALPGVSIHWYGKKQSRPGRKLGHATIVRPSVDEAIATAREFREVFRIRVKPTP